MKRRPSSTAGQTSDAHSFRCGSITCGGVNFGCACLAVNLCQCCLAQWCLRSCAWCAWRQGCSVGHVPCASGLCEGLGAGMLCTSARNAGRCTVRYVLGGRRSWVKCVSEGIERGPGMKFATQD